MRINIDELPLSGLDWQWPLQSVTCLLSAIPTNCKCCFLEQETLSTLLSTGFYSGKKRATWKISTRLLNVLPSINKVDYYYYYYYWNLLVIMNVTFVLKHALVCTKLNDCLIFFFFFFLTSCKLQKVNLYVINIWLWLHYKTFKN